MKKFLLNILLFFIIVGTIDFCIGLTGDYLKGHAKGGSTQQFDDLVMKDKHDVLILGSSRAHHHYDTPYLSDKLGIDVYNAGYDGNGIILANGIFQLIINRYKPKLILFDIESSFDIIKYNKDNNNTRYLSRLKPYYNENGISNIFKDVSIDEWRKVHFGMIRYNTDIITLLYDNIFTRSFGKNGFEPFDGVMEKEPDNGNDEEVEEPATDSLKLVYIQKLIYNCKNHDVPIVFVTSPYYNKVNPERLQPVFDIAYRESVPVWNYCTDTSFAKHRELFKDLMHLNREGARKFSEIIMDQLDTIIDRDN